MSEALIWTQRWLKNRRKMFGVGKEIAKAL
jgi:hypothetical protein